MTAFHRRVEVATRETAPGRLEARCAVQDDFHHFRLTVRAAEGRVSEITPEAVRNPNPLCPTAGLRIAELIGIPLNEASAAVNEAVDPRMQCTHQLDLAGVALAALARRRPRRVYEARSPERIDGRDYAILLRDGVEVLRWEMEHDRILAPDPYGGRSLGAGFTRFARTLPLEEAEAALVLRRAAFVSLGRDFDIDDSDFAGPVGGCWAWQPERVAIARQKARRVVWDGRTDELAACDEAWLSFRDAEGAPSRA